ncbi:ANR family transcriptional regulator, partial [Pseudomonas aeruginosa]
MKKLENYRDFSQHAAEMERVGAWEQAESAWEKAATVARCQENQ